MDEEVAAIQATSGGLFSNKNKRLAELSEKQKLERESIQQRVLAAEARIGKARESTDGQVAKIRERIDSRQDNQSNTEDVAVKKEEYNTNIKDAYARIDDMESESFRLKNSQLELEAEVGPVKYIAELLEDFGFGKIDLGGAVRIVIVILVFVFDPLAVVMLLAANLNFRNAKNSKKTVDIATSTTTQKPTTTTSTTTSTTTQKPTTTTSTTTSTTTQKPTTTTSTTTSTTTQKPTTTTSTTTQKPIATTQKPVSAVNSKILRF